ncbi:serine/threonine-protein kinase [Blastococcus sp. KM273128]|uniref:serine/threonine-protein kinase n=1 Tax=Blastococcus sp. KM273128 TaxID=2570314 RepID=UPI001F3F93FF|nr:serine/threonine-protein kinase [Blastococcus sp. KM273128]
MTTAETSRRCLDGRYQLSELIAVGGMGEVWRARDLQLHRTVAVKVLRSEFADDPVFVARFRSEARHAAGLSHPNIAAVLDYGETTAEDTGERLAYLVMELVEGSSLSTRLAQEGSLDTRATLSLLRQAAAGLAEAHRAGVVHRDVKPANILLREDGTVKLTDFGISWSAGSAPITRTGQVVGTAQYMSPEQARGEHVSPASDVYALALVGYESLAGHAAFDGDNPVTVALKQVQETPEPLPAELPPDVRALIDAALVKDPGERPRDGAAFLSAIEETIRRPSGEPPTRSVVAAPVRRERRAQQRRRAAAKRRAAPVTRPAAAATTRRPTLVVLLPLVAFLLLGAGAIVLVPDAGPDSGDTASAAADPSAGEGVVLEPGDLLGRPVAEVAAELGALGLAVRQVQDPTDGSTPGTVTGVDPAGSLLRPGDVVRLAVAVRPGAPETGAEPEPLPVTGGGATPVARTRPVAPAPVAPADEPEQVGTVGGAPADDAADPATEEPAAPPEDATSEPSAPPAEDTGTPTTPPGTGEPTTPPAEDTGTPTTPTTPSGTGEPTTPPAEDTGTPTTPTTPSGTGEPTTPPAEETSTPTTPPSGEDDEVEVEESDGDEADGEEAAVSEREPADEVSPAARL